MSWDDVLEGCRGEHRGMMSWETSWNDVVGNIVQVCRGEHRRRMSWGTSCDDVVGAVSMLAS